METMKMKKQESLTMSKSLKATRNIFIWEWDHFSPFKWYILSLKSYISKSFKMIILLVEDDLDRMRELKKCFESRCVKVVTAQSGSEARLILRRQSFDRIFSDINMPFGSGYALIENILKDGTKGSTPFFMYSAKSASENDVEF